MCTSKGYSDVVTLHISSHFHSHLKPDPEDIAIETIGFQQTVDTLHFMMATILKQMSNTSCYHRNLQQNDDLDNQTMWKRQKNKRM